MGPEGGDEAQFTFVCPECRESLTVNEPMRDALVDRGCVICGAELSRDAFTAENKETN